MGFILGLIIGAIFSPILIKLGKMIYAKITTKVDSLDTTPKA